MFCPINWCFLIFLQFQQWERVFKPSCLAAILYCSSTICSRLPVSLSLRRRAKWRGKTMPSGCRETAAAFFSPFFARLLFRLFTLTVCLALAVFFKKWRSLTVCSLNQVWLHNVGNHAQYCRHSPLGNRCYSLHPGTGVRFVLQALYTFLQSTTSIA